MRTTHTYATLKISEQSYEEIKKKLEDAGYEHLFHFNEDCSSSPIIDMQGIALVPEVEMIGLEESPQY